MEGFAKLGSLLASYPELASYRKYGQLNHELLCYKQAEINQLESEIEVLRGQETVETAQSWTALSIAEEPSAAARKRHRLIELDRKMRIYRQDLLEVVQLEAMSSPSKLCVDKVRQWLGDKDGGKDFFKASEGRQWWSRFEKDLVAVSYRLDTLDRACINSLSPVFHAVAYRWKRVAGDEEKGLDNFCRWSPKYFTRIADVLCILMSTAVPSASVIGLFYTKTMEEKLVMISTFILVFAIVILFGFGLKRSETFAATVAFAAVQVVFVESVNSYTS